MRDRNFKKTKRASIFFFVLWTIVFFSIFAVSLGHIVQQRIEFVKHLDEKNKTYLISLAGLNRAIAQIKAKKKEKLPYDCLKEAWSSKPEIFKEIPIGEGSFSVSYQYRCWKSDDILTRFGVIDEERKINVNKVNQEVLSLLFQYVGGLDREEAEAIAASIIDWRDPESRGAEEDYYQNLDSPYGCKNSPLESIEELLLVKGINEERFSQIEDYVTVYTSGKININTVEGVVLLCLGLEPELVDKILKFRCGSDSIEATDDDNVFSAVSNIISDLSRFCELSFEEESSLNNLVSQGLLTVCSENFMIKSKGRLEKKNEWCKITCVFEASQGKIIYWQRKGLRWEDSLGEKML